MFAEIEEWFFWFNAALMATVFIALFLIPLVAFFKSGKK